MPDAALEAAVAGLLRRIADVEEKVTRRAASSGLTFWRANRQSDGNFDPLVSGDWEMAAPEASGTINWQIEFGIDSQARVILAYVTGTISFRVGAESLDPWSTTGEQRWLPVSASGTTYWFDASGAVTVRVLGWLA